MLKLLHRIMREFKDGENGYWYDQDLYRLIFYSTSVQFILSSNGSVTAVTPETFPKYRIGIHFKKVGDAIMMDSLVVSFQYNGKVFAKELLGYRYIDLRYLHECGNGTLTPEIESHLQKTFPEYYLDETIRSLIDVTGLVFRQTINEKNGYDVKEQSEVAIEYFRQVIKEAEYDQMQP